MSTSPRNAKIAALVLLSAAGGLFCWLKIADHPVPRETVSSQPKSAPGQHPAGPAGRSEPKPPGLAGARPGTSAAQAAKINSIAVTIELEPDMAFFEASGGGLGVEEIAALREGRLAGKELTDALAALRGTAFADLPLDVAAYLASEDLAVRQSALAVLAASGSEGLAFAWEAVKDGRDPAATLAVMRIAASKGGEDLATVLKDGMQASHPQIRYDAMELVEPLQGRDEETRREVLAAAASSSDPAVASAAVGQLTHDPRKADLGILFDFLDHPDAGISATARGTIDFLIDAEFKTRAEAAAWWEQNAARFDDELSPVE